MILTIMMVSLVLPVMGGRNKKKRKKVKPLCPNLDYGICSRCSCPLPANAGSRSGSGCPWCKNRGKWDEDWKNMTRSELLAFFDSPYPRGSKPEPLKPANQEEASTPKSNPPEGQEKGPGGE